MRFFSIPLLLALLSPFFVNCSSLSGYSGSVRPPSKSSTSAKGPLFAQTMGMISRDQEYFKKDGCQKAKVSSVRKLSPISNSTNVYDRKGNIISGTNRELWTVDRCGRKVRYQVTYKRGKKGTEILMDVN